MSYHTGSGVTANQNVPLDYVDDYGPDQQELHRVSFYVWIENTSIGTLLATIYWHDGTSARQQSFLSLSLLSTGYATGSVVIYHDTANQGDPSVDFTLVGVLGSPSYSYRITTEPVG